MARKRKSTADLFWPKVARGEPDECWPWTASVTAHYGSGYMNGKREGAHRISWTLHFGPIPEGMHVLHTCDNPLCVNPAHLKLGTHAENMQDKARKGRCGVPRGIECPAAKLNDDKVREVRRLLAEGKSQRYIAKLFGVASPVISTINTGKAWAHVKRGESCVF